jgi:hypothetical protein
MDLTLTEKEEFMQEHLVVWVFIYVKITVCVIYSYYHKYNRVNYHLCNIN